MDKLPVPPVPTEEKQKQGLPQWFKPGQSGNPKGRQKGSRNKLGEDFLSKLQADFAEHGTAAIETVRKERPHEYLKVVASILPKELNVTTNAVTEMSDDDIHNALAALQSLVAQAAAPSGTDEKTKH